MQNQNFETKKIVCAEIAKRLAKYPQYDHRFNWTQCYLIQLRINWEGKGRSFPVNTIGILEIGGDCMYILVDSDILDVYPIHVYTTQYNIIG